MARQRILPAWISIDPSLSEPLYRQISRQIEDAVHDGRLAPGTYLPASRSLASNLGVSRLTVLTAYELLVADGLLEAITGSGTRVSVRLPDGGPASPNATVLEVPENRPREPADLAWLPHNLGPMAFRTGVPALDLFPRRVWSKLLRRHGLRGDHDILDYGYRGGYAPLREMIARYLVTSRGVQCSPSQVIVVAGVRAAISLACSVLTTPGETGVWGDPGYRWARGGLELSGLRIVPVAVDDGGLRVDDLASRAPDARIAYATPCHHWPTGVTLDPGRRNKLLAWARQRQAWILEDDYDSEFRFDGPPTRPLAAESDSERVIFMGTFAKTMAPSIRCAYLVVPENLEQRFVDNAIYLGVEPALHIQAALADFINEGYYTRHIQTMRKVYRARRDALEQSLTETLGDRLSVRHPEGGLQLIADLPTDISAEVVSDLAAQRELTIRPMSIYYAARAPLNALHLGFAAVPEPEIAPAVQRLAEVINTSA